MNVAVVITVQIGISSHLYSQVVGLCSLPQEWDGLWYDSRKKEVTLNRTTSAVQSGWTLTAYTSTVTSWTCVEQSIDKYLMKSDQEVDVFGAPNAAYLCLTVTKVTDVSYRYTIIADEQTNAGNERVSVIATTRNASISSDCTAVSPPGPEEFHVLVKADNVSDAKQYFPEPLLATLYNSNYARTNSTCDSDVVLDMCSDRYIMNRTECSTSSGQICALYFCITYVQDGEMFFVSMLDPDVTGSNQQHLKCYAVMKLNDQIYISDNNGSCAKGQDPNVRQVNGTETLVMYANVLCPFTTSPNEEDVDIGLIIGCVIASIIFIGIVIAIIIICLRKKYREKIRKTFCSKCKHKVQQKDDERQELSEKEKTQSNGTDDNDETNNNEDQTKSILFDEVKNSTQKVSGEVLTTAEVEGASYENSRNLIMTPVELLDNTFEDIEVGKAPVDVQKYSKSGIVVDHANLLSEIEDEDSAFRVKESEKEKKSVISRQNTEEDMEQLRRINREVNSEKHLFIKENMPLDNEMSTSEQIYFQKSVFAKQNVEAEMYLNEPIDESDDHAILSSSLPVILEAHEGISYLNSIGVTSSPIHTTGFVPDNPQTKKDNDGMEDTGEIKGMVIEDLDFSLTEEQIMARSSLSSALTSRLSSRMTPTSEILAKELRKVLSPSKRISKKKNKPRAWSKSSFHSAPEMRSRIKECSERYQIKPVLRRASTKMSILKIATIKRKLKDMGNEPRAPKMKFRWI